MSRFVSTSNAIALLACTVLLVSSIGCSPGTPTAPSSAPPDVVESPNFIRILSAASSKGVQGPNLTDTITSKMISAAEGGVISNGRVTLVFPPEALDEDTEIFILMETDGTLGVELGPHGIQFNRPVVMTMDLTGTTAEGLSAASTTLWYNEDQDWWELIEKIPSDDPDALTSSLEHFSGYKGVING